VTSAEDAPSAVNPSGREWVIAADGHQATVVEVGAGLRSYTVDGVDLLDGYPADELPKGCRGQVLAPFANRIRDGSYTFAGVEHQLDIGEIATNTAFHGLVRWQPWEAVVVEPDSVVLGITVHARDGYPFTLRLGVRYTVGPDGLTAEHTAQNLGAAAAPFMMATHCYPTVVGLPVDELRLTVPAGSWLATDERLLPLPVRPVAGTDRDFTDGPVFGDRVVDNAFGDLTREADGLVRAMVTAPDGHGVQVWSGAAFRWLQVYSSDTQTEERFRRSFAIEPMTGPPDNFRSGVDLVVLEPGAAWQGTWGIRPIRGATDAAGGAAAAGASGESATNGAATGAGRTVTGPPVTGTAADLLPDVTTDEAEIRRVDPTLGDYAAGGDDERILREVPPHHLD
jgi:aldose 1-epimerase